MKQQTIIKVGNSLAVTLPKKFVDSRKIKAGQKVYVEADSDVDFVHITTKSTGEHSLTPEFYDWLKKFNSKYKNALTELAKK